MEQTFYRVRVIGFGIVESRIPRRSAAIDIAASYLAQSGTGTAVCIEFDSEEAN